MIIFDGNKLAQEREAFLKQKVSSIGHPLKIAAVLFTEDAGSQLYTRLKAEAAQRVGITYEVHEFSLSDAVEIIKNKIQELNLDTSVTGIIIQKPWRKTWLMAQDSEILSQIDNSDDTRKTERELYSFWWDQLTATISQEKDVDGLQPQTIQNIKEGTWQEQLNVLPATCQAVLTILEQAEEQLGSSFTQGKYIVLGKSDLLGIPLFYELMRQGKDVEILASKELNERMVSGKKLFDASVIISATGRKGLVTGDMVSEDVVIVDVGEPRADVEFSTVSQKASFITPVPGGVGPMTVISLLENCVELVK